MLLEIPPSPARKTSNPTDQPNEQTGGYRATERRPRAVRECVVVWEAVKLSEYGHMIWQEYMAGKYDGWHCASPMTSTLNVLLEEYPPRCLSLGALLHCSNAPHFLTLDLIIWKTTR